MSEPIKTKRCSKCKEIKPLDKFHKRKDRISKGLGVTSRCKQCRNEHSRKYRNTPRGNMVYQKALYRWQRSEKGRHYQCEYRKKNREKNRARDAVKYAVRVGKLPSPKTLKCYFCFGMAQEYHHHKGYARENRLDVLSVCKLCHRKFHNQLYFQAVS